MKPRDFRFGPLLKYKAFIEETMMNELTDVREKMDNEEKRLFALEEIWRQAAEEFEERQKRQIPPYEMFMYQTYLYQISIEIEAQRKVVMEAEKLYYEKRESLISASQERKIVEKVEERDAQITAKEAKRAQKKVMDETAKNRYVRKNC